MIYVVLGMHKSGTTLISQIMHASGINMGKFDESVGYDNGNQFERRETLELNKALLGAKSADKSFDVVANINECKPSPIHIGKMKDIIKEYTTTYSDWGFKDPRSCLTYSIWQQFLPEHRLICVYRSPWEVIEHYCKHIPSYRWIRLWRDSWKAAKGWYIYNKKMLNYLKNSNIPYLIINFQNFMNNKNAINQLEDFIGIPLYDCRKNDLYRSKGKQNLKYIITIGMMRRITFRDIGFLYTELEDIESQFE